uniref:Uncharacterized protein n=1 Tax=Heterorhabditis bacteriophora TaxID=37862 RepID=A0A1I7X336_HETBA
MQYLRIVLIPGKHCSYFPYNPQMLDTTVELSVAIYELYNKNNELQHHYIIIHLKKEVKILELRQLLVDL